METNVTTVLTVIKKKPSWGRRWWRRCGAIETELNGGKTRPISQALIQLCQVLPLIWVACCHWGMRLLKTDILTTRSVSNKACLFNNTTQCSLFLYQRSEFKGPIAIFMVAFALDSRQAVDAIFGTVAPIPLGNAWVAESGPSPPHIVWRCYLLCAIKLCITPDTP